jgi:hypothetical protein
MEISISHRVFPIRILNIPRRTPAPRVPSVVPCRRSRHEPSLEVAGPIQSNPSNSSHGPCAPFNIFLEEVGVC